MSNDNAKVSDSGYANTCEHSQSQQKSGSSPSNKNSNRSGSSGYCGDHPFNSGISNEALTQPISEKKDKEHQKKKSKTTTPLGSGTKSALKSVGQQTKTGPSTVTSNILDQKFEKSEVGNVELVDAKKPDEHNGDSNFIIPKREIVSQINSPDNISPKLNDGFYTVVSLNDGLILYSSSSLQTALGYPINSWLGCSFIDFVHPNNRKLFMDKLSDGIFLLLNNRQENINEQQTNFVCNLRCNPHNISKNDDSDAKQKSLHQIQIVTDNENTLIKTSAYLPFHLSLCFKNFPESTENAHSSTMTLIIRSEPILSAYEAAENKITSFTTRHNANCRFTHLDDEVVEYFGYLPQDMMGRSVFDYYHPEDMPFIKEIYKTITRLSGAAFKSKPYRFYIHNGEYILLETEWSAFVNPWEKKIEFVIGQHRVIRGPVDINIFNQTQQQLSMTNIMNDNLSEEVLIKSRIIEGEICALLAERIQSCTFDHGSAMKFKDIASFVENKTCDNDKKSLPTSRTSVMDTDGKRFSKHEGVMAGEFYSDETPLSYHQLNYNDKIERFFNSKPIVTIGSVVDEKIFHSNSKTPNSSPTKNDSGGRGSGEYFSNGSNNSTSGKDILNNNSNSTSTDNFQTIPLTEILLKKHNQDMEQLMIQKHKKHQSNIKTGNSHRNNTKNDDNIIIIINNNNNNNNIATEEPKLEKTKDKKIQDKSRNGKRNGCLIPEHEHVKVPRYNGNNKNTEKLLVKKHRERLSSVKTSRMDINTQRNQSESEESELTNSWSRRDRKRKAGHVCKEELFKIPMKNKRNRSSTKNNNTTLCVKTKIDKFVLNEVRTSNNMWSQLPSAYQNTLHPSGLNQILPIYYAPVTHIQIDNKNMESQSALPQYSSVLFDQYQYQYQYQQSPFVSYPASYGGIVYPTIINNAGSARTQFTYPSMMAQAPSQLDNLQKPVTSLAGKNATELKWPIGQDTSVKAELGSIMAATESSKKLYSPSYHYSSCVSINDRNGQNESSTEDSSDSSFYGSFLNTSTDSSSNCHENDYAARISEINALYNGAGESTNRRFGMINNLKNDRTQHNVEATTSSLQKKGLPWYHSVKMTPETIYNYQMSPKALSEVLKDDLKKLKTYKQPHLVTDQIGQLYLDQELESFGTKLILDGSNSSRDCDSVNHSTNCTSYVPSQVRHECTILYEKK